MDSTMEIPARVHCQVPIEIRTSEIACAGRGLFALADIKAGELIFSILKPLVTVTGITDPTVQQTCDNCFASNHRTGATTVPADDLQIFACMRCKMSWYCSKACQDTAWESYHRSECKAFVGMKDLVIGGNPILTTNLGICLRLLIRLLILRDLEMINDADWTALLALQTNREIMEEENKELKQKQFTEYVTACIAELTETTIPMETIKDLYYAIQTNVKGTIQLLLRGSGADYEPSTPFNLNTGLCLDPFASMLNNDCDANSRSVFEGTELQIRAQRDIPTGQEITVGYTSEAGDYIGRRESLKKMYHFDCMCDSCKKGPIGPLGELRARIVEFNDRDAGGTVDEVEGLINEIKDAGFGLDAWPMRLLHNAAWISHMAARNEEGVLKALLTLYFVIELSSPFVVMDEKLDTLHHLLNTFQTRLVKGFDKKLVKDVWGYLRAKRVADVETFFGADSAVAKFEKKSFKGKDMDWKTIEASESFQESLKELLGWAGLSLADGSEL